MMVRQRLCMEWEGRQAGRGRVAWGGRMMLRIGMDRQRLTEVE
jgi:hypothetical protein